MLEVQKYLQNHSIEELKEEFNIVVTDYEDRVVLNYNQIASLKFHPIVQECRALILSKPDFKVLSRSFNRFYNLNEDPRTKEFDITKAVVQEKLDGSLVILYNDGTKWNVQTRKMAFAEGTTAFGNTYESIVLKALGTKDLNEHFRNGPKSLCFVCEVVSPENRVVKPYGEYAIYLLAVYDKHFEMEFNIKSLDSLAKSLGFKRPKIYTFKSFDDVITSFKELDQFDEGYVCVIEPDYYKADYIWPDEHDPIKEWKNELPWRIKVKSPAYLAIAHLRENGVISIKRVALLVLMNEYEEYLSVYEIDKPIFEPYIKAYSLMICAIQDKLNEVRYIEDQKEFAKQINNLPYASVLFQMKKFKFTKSLEDVINDLNETSKIRLLEMFIDPMEE